MLNNRTYLGEAVHKGTSYPGEHAAIIDQSLWDKRPRDPGRQPAAAAPRAPGRRRRRC
jgi:hypothetical protein